MGTLWGRGGKSKVPNTGVSVASVPPCDAPSSGSLAKLTRPQEFVSAFFPEEVLLLPREFIPEDSPRGCSQLMGKMGSSLRAPPGR